MSADISRRLLSLDVLRGIALVAMVVYHTAWDMDEMFHAVSWDVYSPLWNVVRDMTAGLFIFIAGVTSVVTSSRGWDVRRFIHRLIVIGGAAMLVSLGTYVIAPEQFIWFGILHFLLVMAIITPVITRLPTFALIVFAFISCALGYGWLGIDLPSMPTLTMGAFMTLDYYPLIPWVGVYLAGHIFVRLGGDTFLRRFDRGLGHFRIVAALGRHTLVIYLIHQPIIIGLLWMVFRGSW